jgi:hypothetical protein
MIFGQFSDFLNLALAEQARGPDLPQPEALAADDFDPDRLGQARGLLDPGVERA